jgi:hypothetical protein
MDKDLRLFIEQVSWTGKQRQDESLVETARWICRQVNDRAIEGQNSGSLARVFLHLLQMDTEVQAEAEHQLIELMKQTVRTSVPRWKETDLPTRDVDWAKTYQQALTRPPTRHQNRATERVPDSRLMGGLVYQARQWRDLLNRSSGSKHQERGDALHKAIQQLQRRQKLRIGPLTHPLLQRLRRHGPKAEKATKALLRVYTHQHEVPEPPFLAKRICEAVESTEVNFAESTDAAYDNLLEFSVISSVTRTAASSDTWTDLSFEVPHSDQDTNEKNTIQATLSHRKKPISLHIGKHPPGEDTFTEIRKVAGLAKHQTPEDSQPDICLTFRDERTDENEISVLGDVKRNATDKGTTLLRDGLRTATYYMSAFPHTIQASIADAEVWNPSGDTEVLSGSIRPTFTLFFLQGIEADSKGIGALRDCKKSEIPPILACDIENHFGLENLIGFSNKENEDSDKWQSDFLTQWLDCVTDQAVEYLEDVRVRM